MSPRRVAIAPAIVMALLVAGLQSCRKEEARAAAVEAKRHALFSGTETIAQDLEGCSVDTQATTALDGMSLAAIVEYRRERVARHARLNVFPETYDPLAPGSARIWRQITPSKKWLGPTPYYVANPYVPIVATCANHVTPLNLCCPDVSITYSDRRIRELRHGESARCWLRYVHERPYADQPGSVRLVMVNAFDAGFPFAHLDRARSENVLPEASPANVTNGLFSQSSFFHVGRYAANNISPEDRKGWVRLSRPDARTLLTVKLWRRQPPSPKDDSDLEYVIDLDPEQATPTGGAP